MTGILLFLDFFSYKHLLVTDALKSEIAEIAYFVVIPKIFKFGIFKA